MMYGCNMIFILLLYPIARWYCRMALTFILTKEGVQIMQRGSRVEHFSMRWWHLVKEIRELEELIAEANRPDDVHAV